MSTESTELTLRDSWALSYQGFGPWETTPVAGEIRSAQTFWQVYNNTPQASLLTTTAEGPRVVIAEPVGNIRSILLFREFIGNKLCIIEMGAPGMAVVYRYQVPDMEPEALDFEWEEVQLSAIGESCNSDTFALSGVRLLDRTKKGNVAHRFEFWCSKEAEDVKSFVESRAEVYNVNVEIIHA